MTWATPVPTYDEINLVRAEEGEENSNPALRIIQAMATRANGHTGFTNISGVTDENHWR
jgi:hypothetical protein